MVLAATAFSHSRLPYRRCGVLSIGINIRTQTHCFHHGLHKVGALAGLDGDDVAEELAGRGEDEADQIVRAIRVDQLAVLGKSRCTWVCAIQ